MKKTLLATAIATAMAASGAQAATVYNQDGTKLDIYGNLQIAYKTIETVQDDGSVDSEDELFDNGSTIGIKGEHVISEGLTGYFKAEWEFDADESKGPGGIDTGDQAYMGLKGDFGDARVGSWDPLIDDWIQDPITNNEYFDASDSSGRIVGIESREGNKLQYASPSFNGLQFALGTQFEGDAEDENYSDSSNASAFGGVKYTAGAFSVAAVYDNLDNNDGDYAGTGEVGGIDNFDAGDQYGITAQYTVNTLRVAVKYERFEADSDETENVDYYALGARYGYGMGDLYGAYQYVEVDDEHGYSSTSPSAVGVDDSDESYDEVVIGATYNISDAMYTFVEAAWYDREDDEGDGVSVGAVYLF